MNKKSLISLKFLVWTIVGLGIFIPGCILFSKYVSLESKTSAYNDVIRLINDVADKKIELKAEQISIKGDSALIGFTEKAERFEYWHDNKMESSLKAPSECKGKSCLCLCEGISTKMQEKVINIYCEKVICKPFDNVDFFKSLYIDEEMNKIWKNGFVFTNTLFYNKVVGIDGPTKVVYAKRFDESIAVCSTSKCEEVKEISPFQGGKPREGGGGAGGPY